MIDRAGIDGGGVFKEFLTSLSREVFDKDRGLWLANKKNELYPNPHSYATECAFFPFSFSSSLYHLLVLVLVLLPPNRFLTTIPAHSLSWYRFIGRILGKAMYEGILIDVPFAGFFLSKVRQLSIYAFIH